MGETSSVEAEFNHARIPEFIRDIQEATRASRSGESEIYVPPKNGEIAESNYHHFVFGQRGSGKSSLLGHLEQKMDEEGRLAVWIDQEVFSSLPYPDVLVSVVLELMIGVGKTLQGKIPKNRSSWYGNIWKKFSGPSELEVLIGSVRQVENQLLTLKHAPLDRKIEWVLSGESGSGSSFGGSLKAEIVTVDAKVDESSRSSYEMKEVIEGTKEQFLERSLPDFRRMLLDASRVTGGGFVFVDDLYQISRDFQPLVLGYLHRLLKDTQLWLKIGSIRYSTINFKPGDPPRGMQIGHDAQEVPLDRGLRHFSSAQGFLEEILSRIASRSEIEINKLYTEDARKRLVLAAGGVARDYLRLASDSITEARNRGISAKPGSGRVIVEDVNKAAGLISPSKISDLKIDEPEEARELESLVREITNFCRQQKSAYFLVATDDTGLSEKIDKLQNLRFTHLLVESETVPDKGSQRFNVWLLDVAELSAQRATTGMDFLKWEKREKRRNRKLIFTLPES